MYKNKHLPIIIVISILLRMFYISNPVLDWHSFRQADTASVTYEYVQHGVDLLQPKFHDLSNIASGKDNLAGYRMVEFPWSNAVVASILRLWPQFSLATTSRIFSLFFSLGTLLGIYFLVKLFSGKTTALLAAATFAILPYAVFYSRVILPDPIMLGLSTASIAFFAYWLREDHWWQYLASFGLLMLASLTKPFVLFLAPVYLALMWVQATKHRLSWRQLVYCAVMPISLLPLWWWRHWILQFPPGIPASDWLYNGPIAGKPVRFHPVWFRWLGYERLTKLILGYAGIVLAAINILQWKKIKTQELLVYGSWWLSIVIYFSVIARGNIQHDYYQILAIPIICITIAKGSVLLFYWANSHLQKKVSALMVAVPYLLMLAFSYNLVKEYYKINHWEYQKVGKRVQKLIPKDGLVIAPAFGDTTFLFQTRHRGWPIGFEIDKKIALGAQYYVTTSYDDEARMLESQYQTIEKTPEYLLINLQKPL